MSAVALRQKKSRAQIAAYRLQQALVNLSISLVGIHSGAEIMAKRTFLISKAGKKTIQIAADDGIIIDDWKDETAPSCLVFGAGRFRIEDSKTVFFQDGSGDVFVLMGKPFGADQSGSARLLLIENGCDADGWLWTRKS